MALFYYGFYFHFYILLLATGSARAWQLLFWLLAAGPSGFFLEWARRLSRALQFLIRQYPAQLCARFVWALPCSQIL